MSGRTNIESTDEIDQSKSKGRTSDRSESQTVLRTCEVLKAFRHLGEELTLLEVMERTGLAKTTSFRLLRTLIHSGLIERVGPGVYRNRLGPIKARRGWSGLPANSNRSSRA